MTKALLQVQPDAWKVAQYKCKGYSLSRIYTIFGGQYSIEELDYMLKLVIQCNKDTAIDNQDMMRQLLMDRLDAVSSQLHDDADEMDAKTANTLVRIVEAQAKLLGLNAPEKVEVNITKTIQDANETLKEKMQNMKKFTEVIDV